MKKFWKVLGTTALLASVIPFKVKKEGNKKTITALLWSATDRPDCETGEKHKININIKFNNPFEKIEETHLFTDDLTVDYNGPESANSDDTIVDDVKDAVKEVVEDVQETAKDVVNDCKDKVENAVDEIKEEIKEETETPNP